MVPSSWDHNTAITHRKMYGVKKSRQMRLFEINNCRKNISFYKSQIKKGTNNKRFYSKEIVAMKDKISKLRNELLDLQDYSKKLL